jgi:hypothetical protein
MLTQKLWSTCQCQFLGTFDVNLDEVRRSESIQKAVKCQGRHEVCSTYTAHL